MIFLDPMLTTNHKHHPALQRPRLNRTRNRSKRRNKRRQSRTGKNGQLRVREGTRAVHHPAGAGAERGAQIRGDNTVQWETSRWTFRVLPKQLRGFRHEREEVAGNDPVRAYRR